MPKKTSTPPKKGATAAKAAPKKAASNKAPPADKAPPKKAPSDKASPKKDASGAAFQGFADSGMKFFHALAKHQDREWFAEHKAEFEEGWSAPMKALLAEVRERIDDDYPDCDLPDPKVFRVHRDVRFGADKSPYKTNVSGLLSARVRGNAMEVPAALYVQFGVESFGAAGQYTMDGPTLARYRAAVQDDDTGSEVAKLIGALEKKGFRTDAMEVLKTAPRGIDPSHPRIELLKKKGLVVMFPPIPEGIVHTRAIADWLVARAREAAPLVRWLVFNTA